MAFSVCAQTYLSQDKPWQFNYEFNEALKEQWTQPQEWKELSLFDEARKKVQNIKNTPKDTKTTELIHTIGDDFCKWLFGSCDESSLNARLMAWCGTARDEAIEKMQANDVWFVKTNTELLLASYTTCLNLANDVTEWYKVAASIEAADWNAKKIEDSHTSWAEKMNNTFQEKVGNIWDVFTKKMTNFVRSVQGITKNVYV